MVRRLAPVIAVCAGCACAPANGLVIRSSGTHALDRDVTASGPVAVSIEADNVVLDLNDHTIRCQTERAAGNTIGVAAQKRSSITIKNGSITGCSFGIVAHRAKGMVIDRVDLSDNSVAGAELGSGEQNVVRCSRAVGITGDRNSVYSFGINGIGRDGLIEDNVFGELYRQRPDGVGEGVGVVVEEGATGVKVRRNIFTNRDRRPNTIAIWSAINAETEVQHNVITDFEHAVQGDNVAVLGNTFTVGADFLTAVAILINRGVETGNQFRGYQRTVEIAVADLNGHANTVPSQSSCR